MKSPSKANPNQPLRGKPAKPAAASGANVSVDTKARPGATARANPNHAPVGQVPGKTYAFKQRGKTRPKGV